LIILAFIENILRKGICKTDFIVKEFNKKEEAKETTAIMRLAVSGLSFFC